ncbi:MAG: PAS domain-containing protein, partial [Clostridiales Family XIII bacterium]|nr:PAS domain-containing protein [Clostridiales Family XIII bacterium]
AFPFVVVLFVLSLVIGYFLATRLTRRVVRPINDFDFDGDIEAPYDELVPFVRAIDMQRQQISAQMRELRERSDTIHSIMENMNEGAVLLGAGGTILSVNRSATALFGVEGDLTGHDVHELFRDGRLLDLTKEALQGRRCEMDMPRDGLEYHVFFSPVPPDGAILLFLDVTERLRAERLRREFSANVSHELKTPLTSITGYAEMLVNGMAKEGDRTDFATRIRDEAWRMISLVEDIMLLSHLDEGVPDAPFEEVDLLGAARAAAEAESVKMKATEADVHVEVGMPSPTAPPTTIRANPSMIGELLANLIDNAVKYNRPGGRVDVTAAIVDGCAVLRVADTGIGIPKEEQDRVFERFYRVDKSRSKDTGGTGLGLAIVKHIAIIHGAQLVLESEPGRGTAIKVSFPAPPSYLPLG